MYGFYIRSYVSVFQSLFTCMIDIWCTYYSICAWICFVLNVRGLFFANVYLWYMFLLVGLQSLSHAALPCVITCFLSSWLTVKNFFKKARKNGWKVVAGIEFTIHCMKIWLEWPLREDDTHKSRSVDTKFYYSLHEENGKIRGGYPHVPFMFFVGVSLTKGVETGHSFSPPPTPERGQTSHTTAPLLLQGAKE